MLAWKLYENGSNFIITRKVLFKKRNIKKSATFYEREDIKLVRKKIVL